MNKDQSTKHNIANKGFGGVRRFVVRFILSCNLIRNRPKFRNFSYRQRWQQTEETTLHINLEFNE